MVGANEVKNRSVDWRGEAALADHVLSNEDKNIDSTRGLSEDELVSPSIYSVGGEDRRMDVP